MGKKRNNNRKGYEPYDELAYEMAKLEDPSSAGKHDPVEKPSARIDKEPNQAMAEDAAENNQDDREETLDRRAEELDAREQALIARESAVVDREKGASEREETLNRRAEALDSREHTLAAHENEVADREKEVSEKEDELVKKRTECDASLADIIDRETAIKKAELERDEGFRLAKSTHDQRIQEDAERSKSEIAKREKEAIAKLQQDLAELRKNHDEALKAELDAGRASIESERASWKKEYDRQAAELAAMRAEVDKQRGALDAQQSDIDRRIEDFDLDQLGFERQRQRFEARMEERKDELDSLAEEMVQARKEEFEAREQESREERDRLLEQLQTQERLLESFRELEQQLGGRHPQSVLAELRDLKEANARLDEDMLSGAAFQQMQNRADEAESRYHSTIQQLALLQSQRNDDAQRLLDYDAMSFKLQEMEQELEYANRKAKNATGEVDRLSQELDRYQSAYEKPKERETRIREIEEPYFTIAEEDVPEGQTARSRMVPLSVGQAKEINEKISEEDKKIKIPSNELEWLETIGHCCDEYGLHFNPRLLKAFHTSLKTAEWSPLTVLAGVSGTGKSELPRLYSHFGGIYFMPISVQPNWDSKESMLGFFNSIDNKYNAEPVLHFLAQSQKDWIEGEDGNVLYPGLKKSVCMILLDEMNLAHPELYFADFLSKLELRRGVEGDAREMPSIEVELGTGMVRHPIPLGRNMLWVGTMNQDETTKSLSDKVLDRSIVMNFPRPTELKRRAKIKPLNQQPRPYGLMHFDTWNSWKVRTSQYDEKWNPAGFHDEEILPYKRFVEEMNDALGKVGRAIGHRVWQSVEYYMASYPDVRLSEFGTRERAQALHTAFEDQIVQKIMPKLRGIETSGESEKKCLIPIKNLLLRGVDMPFDLTEDFELACRLGYGQFVWQTANYLRENLDQATDEQ